MTQLLEQAIGEAQKLAPAEQDAIAALILDELDDDRRWDEAFAKSQEPLAKLAEKVKREIAEGRSHNMGIDEL